MTSAEPLHAVLWDLDGTLMNSEPFWMGAETRLAADFGVEWTEAHARSVVGIPIDRASAELVRAGVDLPVSQVAENLVASVAAEVQAHVPWQPGARELLAALREAGVPCALVTMSFPSIADAVIRGCPEGTFGAVVTGDQVSEGKPDPEGYLTAAARLGVDIERCVVVEDSPSGIGAGLASGARTVGVQVIVDVPPRPGLSRTDSLLRLSLERLRRLVAGEVFDDLAIPVAHAVATPVAASHAGR